MTDLNLKVHGTGYDCSLEALDMKTAWTKVDLPNRNKAGTKIPTVPTSNFFFLRLVPHKQLTRKLMKVQHRQSEYYHQARNISIDGFSQTALKKKEEELNASNFYYNAMLDKVVQLVTV